MKKILSIIILLICCNSTAELFAQTYSGSKTVNAGQNMTISLFIDPGNDSVRVTMTGPDGVWYGYGFDNAIMTNTYSFITDGAGVITERKLGNHAAGTLLTSSLTSSSHSSGGGIGTTIVTRSLSGMTGDYYTFLDSALTVSIIWGYGNGSALAYHAARGATTITINEDCINTSSSINASSACPSYTSPSGNYMWTSNGVYKDTVANAGGCDSVITVNLTIDTATISPVGDVVGCKPFSVTLNAPAGTGLTYLWSNGATTQSIIETDTDSLTVTVTDDAGCSTTSPLLATRAVNRKKLGAVFCGRMNLSTFDVLWAEFAWSQPYSTEFEWEIKNKNTQVINNYITPGRTIDLGTTFVEEGESYRVRVRLKIDGDSVANCWGDSCMIGTFPDPGITPGTLITYDCDKPVAPRSSIIAELVTEGLTAAIRYQYSFYTDSALTNLAGSVALYGRLCPFSAVPGISGGIKYWVTVRGFVPAIGPGVGGWGPIGSVCTVTPQPASKYTHDNNNSSFGEEKFNTIAVPNPFDNTFKLYIDASSDKTVDIVLADISGRIINEIHGVNPINSIELGSELSSGVYFVRVSQGTKSQVVKLIKSVY